ncbi:sulfur carrier protein ThiS [Actinoplanes sp. RD1]|uniref:sulfur carrier protein ThiS n=1 Tax=Actinoplanes sp. RD1 TaxID=3064538 RepID=UPI0027416336|nr:sulfur carrier protein ThiS [Actinoplanes sp. RD1]
MNVTVNGSATSVAATSTVEGLVAGVTEARRGVAVAVNGEVVPRSAWSGAVLREGDKVEILTAAQGG